jgi:3-deoxy-7-phosphoheptulonate synthase
MSSSPTGHLPPLLPAAPARGGHTRVVRIGPLSIGGDAVPVIAGPCAVEPGYVAHATAVAAAGAAALRGCVHKPRTRPESFQGLGADGLPLLDEARRATGLPVLSEPLQPEDVSAMAPHCDALLIGARSMQNIPLLRAAGRSGMPVVLKRGIAATYDEWLGAADYIRAEGDDDVILCERGIRSFETATRNTLDVSAIPVLRERCDLPVIVDPSHAAGLAAWGMPLALAAVAAGADGLLVECHPQPDASWSDPAQALSPDELRRLVAAVELLAPLVRPASTDTLHGCRESIDGIDAALAHLLERRARVVSAVRSVKADNALPDRDTERERAIVRRVVERAPRLGAAGAELVMGAVIDACVAAAGGGGAADPIVRAGGRLSTAQAVDGLGGGPPSTMRVSA